MHFFPKNQVAEGHIFGNSMPALTSVATFVRPIKWDKCADDMLIASTLGYFWNERSIQR